MWIIPIKIVMTIIIFQIRILTPARSESWPRPRDWRLPRWATGSKTGDRGTELPPLKIGRRQNIFHWFLLHLIYDPIMSIWLLVWQMSRLVTMLLCFNLECVLCILSCTKMVLCVWWWGGMEAGRSEMMDKPCNQIGFVHWATTARLGQDK